MIVYEISDAIDRMTKLRLDRIKRFYQADPATLRGTIVCFLALLAVASVCMAVSMFLGL